MKFLMRSGLLALLVCAMAAGQSSLAQAQSSSGTDFVLPETDDGLPGAGPIRRYDWFRNLWKRRRSEFAALAPRQKESVVFFGDSITQGWGNDFKNHFPELSVANRGISGDTTRGMLIRIEQDVLSVQPKAVVMLMGTNDLEEGAAPTVIAENIRLIVDRLHKADPDMPIIFCNVFPSSASKKRPATEIKAINALCSTLPRTYPQVRILDTWTLFANGQGDAKKEEFPDLLHPNNAGYAKWAKALRPQLVTAGVLNEESAAPTAADGFKPLFNGRDLTGWGFRTTPEAMRKSRARWQKNNPQAPPWPLVEEDEAFDNLTVTPNGRFAAIGGSLVVLAPPEGRRIEQLWTTQAFDQDFTLTLQFRALPNADSGVFIRGRQLQCRDYALAGPYKDLAQYRPQQWNDLVITVRGQSAHCTCNGEVLEADFSVPAAGPIGLEGDRGQIEYRAIRLKIDASND